MPRAYSYIRFSTPEQAAGDSLRRQTELSENYAEKHKLVFDKSLDLHDKGLSAFCGANRKKGALAVFLRAVEHGIVKPGSYLLVESLDRLSRDTLSEQMSLFMDLINSGITVVTIADEKVYSKQTIDADMTNLMMSLVIMTRSHEESVMKSRRLTAAWAQKRREIGTTKLTSLCPHWLRPSADRKSFEVIEERAALVRRIYQMSIDGIGQESIARKLNQEGVPAWGRGKGWYAPYIHRLLRKRDVLGEFQSCRRDKRGKKLAVPTGEAVKNYFPAIIDEVTFQKARAHVQTSTPGRVGQSRGNLFTGLAFDGVSGAPMRHLGRGYDKSKLGQKNGMQFRHYYLVSDYKRMNPNAKALSWRYDWFETWFLNYITGLDWHSIVSDELPVSEIDAGKALAAVQVRVGGFDLELERLVKFVAKTDKAPETIMAEMQKLEGAKAVAKAKEIELAKELETMIIRRNALTEAATEFKDLVSRGDAQSRLRLREELRRRIARIDVFPNGADDIHLKDEPVKAPGWPAFKISFVNGAQRWVFCESRKPVADGTAILDSGLPPGTELELRERPDVSRDQTNPGKVLVPVYAGSATKPVSYGKKRQKAVRISKK